MERAEEDYKWGDKPTAFHQHDWICSIVLRKKKTPRKSNFPPETASRIPIARILHKLNNILNIRPRVVTLMFGRLMGICEHKTFIDWGFHLLESKKAQKSQKSLKSQFICVNFLAFVAACEGSLNIFSTGETNCANVALIMRGCNNSSPASSSLKSFVFEEWGCGGGRPPKCSLLFFFIHSLI